MFLSLQGLAGMSSLSPRPASLAGSSIQCWESQSSRSVQDLVPFHHHGQTWLSPAPTALGDFGDTHLLPLGQPKVFAKRFGILG